MTQNRSSAVMQQRAASVIETDDDQRALWRQLDFFPTPPWAARAVVELIDVVEHMVANQERSFPPLRCERLSAWEPACGQGHISESLAPSFRSMFSSDIYAYRSDYCVHDFFGPEVPVLAAKVDWIITNPPFLKAAEFIQRGLDLAQRGVAVLCRQALLESAGRYELLYRSQHRLTVFAPFIERVPMQLGSWDPSLSTATAYAWFLFSKNAIGGKPYPIIMPVPPGTRIKLSRPDDVRRFARAADLPLLEPTA